MPKPRIAACGRNSASLFTTCVCAQTGKWRCFSGAQFELLLGADITSILQFWGALKPSAKNALLKIELVGDSLHEVMLQLLSATEMLFPNQREQKYLMMLMEEEHNVRALQKFMHELLDGLHKESIVAMRKIRIPDELLFLDNPAAAGPGDLDITAFGGCSYDKRTMPTDEVSAQPSSFRTGLHCIASSQHLRPPPPLLPISSFTCPQDRPLRNSRLTEPLTQPLQSHCSCLTPPHTPWQPSSHSSRSYTTPPTHSPMHPAPSPPTHLSRGSSSLRWTWSRTRPL